MPLILMLIPTFILEGRHSGNGFSYAYEEGFLKIFYFGLQKLYLQSVLDLIKKNR
jgi:formiminoglutamase